MKYKKGMVFESKKTGVLYKIVDYTELKYSPYIFKALSSISSYYYEVKKGAKKKFDIDFIETEMKLVKNKIKKL